MFGWLYLQSFVGGLMSYLRYVCYLLIVLCRGVCFSSSCVLCSQCCQFLWIVNSYLSLRFSLAFVYTILFWHISQKFTYVDITVHLSIFLLKKKPNNFPIINQPIACAKTKLDFYRFGPKISSKTVQVFNDRKKKYISY
jgi:hypothetical protein